MASGKGHNPWLAKSRMFGKTVVEHVNSMRWFRNQDQITPLVIVHLQFVLPNYGTISPLTLRTVLLYQPLRQHWKLIFSQVLLLMTCSVFLNSRVLWLFYLCFWHCIDFSCSFVLLFVAQWAAVWRILALYKFPYYYYYYDWTHRCLIVHVLRGSSTVSA